MTFSVFLRGGRQHGVSVIYCMCACVSLNVEEGSKELTRLECPLQSEHLRGGCVFVGAFWQEEAGTLSRITQQQWNVVQRGIS